MISEGLVATCPPGIKFLGLLGLYGPVVLEDPVDLEATGGLVGPASLIVDVGPRASADPVGL